MLYISKSRTAARTMSINGSYCIYAPRAEMEAGFGPVTIEIWRNGVIYECMSGHESVVALLRTVLDGRDQVATPSPEVPKVLKDVCHDD